MQGHQTLFEIGIISDGDIFCHNKNCTGYFFLDIGVFLLSVLGGIGCDFQDMRV